MPYKVVQTIEKGKPVLTAVPQSWEKEGTLYWPKNQADKFMKVEDICPEDSWIPIACELKRDNLSYEEAQAEISSLLYRGVSANEESNRNLSGMEPSTSSRGRSIEFKIESSNQDPLVCDDQSPMALSAGMELILENQKITLENQKIILENQKKVMAKIAEFTTRLDALMSKSSESQPTNTALALNTEFFTLIDSQEALDELENYLKDPGKRNALLNQFSGICSGQGKNTCYVLVDMMFNRKFMTKCSWAGGSRTEETKIPFKIYNNIINFFHSVVYKSDQTFTIFECHNFFKMVLKNAQQRSESKGLRAPHKKHRCKQLSLAQILYVNENDGDEEESQYEHEESLNERAEYSPRKRMRKSYVETSDGETDVEHVERELNESDGTLREVRK